MTPSTRVDHPTTWKALLCKVPEVTTYFWIIKVLCTTVGETAADFLNVNLNFGLAGTSIVTGVLLVVVLCLQFRTKKYIPAVYWLTVALVSVFGTLVTDNLTDRLGVPLEMSTLLFGALLAITFFVWYRSEKTLAIHSIFTRRREIFYWLTILFTFALGTAAGDLMAEGLGLGYLVTGIIIAVTIALIAIARKFKLHSILAFWLIYILTRPLGASIGDYLSQPVNHGGLGLGVTLTSVLFVGGIILIVTYLSLTRKDVISKSEETAEEVAEEKEKGGLWQTIVVLSLLVIAGGVGLHLRQATIQGTDIPDASSPTSALPSGTTSSTSASPLTPATATLGDLSTFRIITQDTLRLVNAGDMSGAKTRVGDLEYEWDKADPRLKAKDKTQWTVLDGVIDTVLRQIRAVNPNTDNAKAELEKLLALMG